MIVEIVFTSSGSDFSMAKKYRHIIKTVQEGSIAEEMGLEAGDELVSINDTVIEDVFDYQFFK